MTSCLMNCSHLADAGCGWCLDCVSELAETTIPRSTVAAALADLRDVWQRRENAVEDAVMEIALGDVLQELDATIAKLGLEKENGKL